MPIYREQRTGKYYIKFTRNGVTYQKTLPKNTDKTTAENYENKWKNDLFLEEMGLTKVINPLKDITFQKFYVEYHLPYVKANTPANLSRVRGVMKDAMPLFKDKVLREIKPFDIERFKIQQQDKPTWKGTDRTPASVARELSILSKLFSLAVKNDFCDYNPVSRVDKPKFNNITDKVLRREDEQRYFDSFYNYWARDICRFALHTGLRQNDILTLTKDKVDFEESIIILTQGKTQRRLVVPLNDVALEILRYWIFDRVKIHRHKKNVDNPLVFPSPRGIKSKGTSVKQACIRASEKAGIERITIRDLRRTFATRLIEEGVDGQTIAELLGHTSTRLVSRYARGKSNLFEAVKKLVRR